MSEGKKGTHRPSCAVITVRDPDGEPVDFHGQEGGTLESERKPATTNSK